jgi:hypothetical protein
MRATSASWKQLHGFGMELRCQAYEFVKSHAVLESHFVGFHGPLGEEWRRRGGSKWDLASPCSRPRIKLGQSMLLACNMGPAQSIWAKGLRRGCVFVGASASWSLSQGIVPRRLKLLVESSHRERRKARRPLLNSAFSRSSTTSLEIHTRL